MEIIEQPTYNLSLNIANYDVSEHRKYTITNLFKTLELLFYHSQYKYLFKEWLLNIDKESCIITIQIPINAFAIKSFEISLTNFCDYVLLINYYELNVHKHLTDKKEFHSDKLHNIITNIKLMAYYIYINN